VLAAARGLCCTPLFQTVTPYRMDEEARALAKRSSLGLDEHPSRKRRKKLSAAACTVTDPEVDHVRQQYGRFGQKLRERFCPGSPTLEDVEANNRPLREHVSVRMTAVEEAQVPYRAVLGKRNDLLRFQFQFRIQTAQFFNYNIFINARISIVSQKVCL
jgi:hypothetical protein